MYVTGASEVERRPPSSNVHFVFGHGVDWHRPGLPSFVKDAPHIFVTGEVVSTPRKPDLGLDAGVAAWQHMRSVAGGLLASAALYPGCESLEIRYVVSPLPKASTRVRMFVTTMTRSVDQRIAQRALSSALSMLPAGFNTAAPTINLPYGSDRSADDGTIVLELRQHEEVTTPQWNYVPADYYYAVRNHAGDGSGWPQFWMTCAALDRPVEISLLFQQTDISSEEEHVLGRVVSELALLSETRTDYDLFGNPYIVPACSNAKRAHDAWSELQDSLRRPLLTRLAVRGELDVAGQVATALASAVAASTGPETEPMTIEYASIASDARQAHFSFDWLEILPWGGHPVWQDKSAPISLRRMPYLTGVDRAAGLLILPVPDDQGTPGFAISRRNSLRRATAPAAVNESRGVRLGDFLHYGSSDSPATIPLTALNQHALVMGMPGYGKTTTVLSMLVEAWREFGIPWCVIEPTRPEYRLLARVEGLEALSVVTLGRDDLLPLRMNPLDPPPGVRREIHASALMSALRLALPLPTPLPQLLEPALDRTYSLVGWDYDTTREAGIPAPTLRDLMRRYDEVFEEAGYEGEPRNIGVAFAVRMRGLLSGSRGRVLDTQESIDWEPLLTNPTVFEMREIKNSEDQALLAALILQRIRAHAEVLGSSGGELRHLTVVEEAHRLLPSHIPMAGESRDEARSRATEDFVNAIAELRSLGEGFVLSTQNPVRLAQAAVDNASCRFIHHLDSHENREAMLRDVGANEGDYKVAPELTKGECLAKWPPMTQAELVRVQPPDGVDTKSIPTDELIRDRANDSRQSTLALLPFPLCTRAVCEGGCVPARRSQGARIALRLRPAVQTQAFVDRAQDEPLNALAEQVRAANAGDVPQRYCALVHLLLERSPVDLDTSAVDLAECQSRLHRAASEDS